MKPAKMLGFRRVRGRFPVFAKYQLEIHAGSRHGRNAQHKFRFSLGLSMPIVASDYHGESDVVTQSSAGGDHRSSAKAASTRASIGVRPNWERMRLASVRCSSAMARFLLPL
jgi:hypothetical protein